MAAGNPTRRIGVLLTAAEWSILFEALRRFAMENEAAGRPDRARLTQRVFSKMTIYRLAARPASTRWRTTRSSREGAQVRSQRLGHAGRQRHV